MAEDRRRPSCLDSELFGVILGAKGLLCVVVVEVAAETTPTKVVASAIFMFVLLL